MSVTHMQPPRCKNSPSCESREVDGCVVLDKGMRIEVRVRTAMKFKR